jgi:hypothetical protein
MSTGAARLTLEEASKLVDLTVGKDKSTEQVRADLADQVQGRTLANAIGFILENKWNGAFQNG